MELRFDAILYSKLVNENSDPGYFKCSCRPQVHHPCSRKPKTCSPSSKKCKQQYLTYRSHLEAQVCQWYLVGNEAFINYNKCI